MSVKGYHLNRSMQHTRYIRLSIKASQLSLFGKMVPGGGFSIALMTRRQPENYFAGLTRILFLFTLVPCNFSIATIASSSSSISTNPKPFEAPLLSSRTRLQADTLPWTLNNSSKFCSSKSRGKLRAISFI